MFNDLCFKLDLTVESPVEENDYKIMTVETVYNGMICLIAHDSYLIKLRFSDTGLYTDMILIDTQSEEIMYENYTDILSILTIVVYILLKYSLFLS